MTSKVLICPYFGDLPSWMDAYWANAKRLEEHGYDFLVDTNESAFRDRVRDRLGILCPPMYNTGNIWDFRPALGYLYQEEIADYDYWGTTDFDCVYGRVEHFYPDAMIRDYDVLTDHWEYLCGPWTLFKNHRNVNECFRRSNVWVKEMSAWRGTGWMEREFSDTVKDTLVCRFKLHHGWINPERLRFDGEALMHGSQEIPFFHFRHTKEWPL